MSMKKMAFKPTKQLI